MPTTNELKRWNHLMGEELGFNPHGEPVYRWEFSEHAHRKKVLVEDERTIAMEWQPTAGGLYMPQPVIIDAVGWPGLKSKWVVTHWRFVPKEEWEAGPTRYLPWPWRGTYHPTNCNLNAGEVPTLAITQEFIGMCKREREHTFADYMNQAEAGLEKLDKWQGDQIDNHIGDIGGAMGNPFPGACGSHHFPSPKFQKSDLIPESPIVRKSA